MSQPELIRAEGLSKSYATQVLSKVDFDLRSGEIHALVGENGAGKSTLVRILGGLTSPDAGTMWLRGALYAPESKKRAESLGVRLVMQELNLIGTLSIAENIFFDEMPHRFGWLDFPRLNSQAREIMRLVGLDKIDSGRPVQSLGVGQQQLVEIASGLSRGCRVLMLDEPTAALSQPESERLFEQIRKLRSAGVGIIYISHRLEEVQRLADRITVLRDGQVVGTRQAGEVQLNEIVRLMVGRELGESLRRANKPKGQVALRVQDVRLSPSVRGVSFEIHQGEILGLAGLMGSGRTETVRAIFGADRPQAGEIFLRGADEAARIRTPRDAVRQGLALLTEDRKSQGLFLPLPVRMNVTLVRLNQFSRRNGWINRSAEQLEAERWVRALNVSCTSPEQPAVELSGGNQQKVIIARWLFRDCDVLIFDEPTRGIDVGAKFEIYQVLMDLAERGKAILVVSSDLKELMAICDRIAVMSAGRIADCFHRSDWTEEKIMAAALSGYLEAPGP